MWVIEESARVTMQSREREAERARLVSEARRQAQQDGTHRAWQWRVESGMDGAFRNLLGWLLSSQRDAPVEPTLAPREPAASPAKENAERDGVSNWYCCPSGCCA
jgi:hypothetical protein